MNIPGNLYFCISHYTGDCEWINDLDPSSYTFYNKTSSVAPLSINYCKNVVDIPNVGYNIYSYLLFICTYYSDLPDRIVFCKSNIFPRHLSEASFFSLLHDTSPLVFLSESFHADNNELISLFSSPSFIEFNDSWYSCQYPKKYFNNFFDFYSWFFVQYPPFGYPVFLSFSPGANYIVDRDLILSRPLQFYQSLLACVSHSQYSGESHFVERALPIIFNPKIEVHKCFYSAVFLPPPKQNQIIRFKVFLIMFKLAKKLIYSCFRLLLKFYFILLPSLS